MLSEEPLDNRLVKLLNSLPAERRFIWVWDSTAREGKPFPLKELSTDVLQGVTRYIDDEVGQAHWIDLVAGVQYTFNECVPRPGKDHSWSGERTPDGFRVVPACERVLLIQADHDFATLSLSPRRPRSTMPMSVTICGATS